MTDVSTQPIRVGVIGLGYAGEAMLKCLQQMAEVEVLALAELDKERLEGVGATYAVPHLYQRYQDLLERDDLDAVSIALPNFLHAPASVAALERGLHVLCEKPLARNGAEAQRMVAAATDARKILKVMFNYRHLGGVSLLKRWIDEGLLGTIYYAKASYMRRRGIPSAGSWFVNPELAGGGPLIDLGVHILDMALFVLGEPEVVTASAMVYNALGSAGIGFDDAGKSGAGHVFAVEDLATAFLRTSTGATLLLESSWATHSSANDQYGLILYGTKGGVELERGDPGRGVTLRLYTDLLGEPVEIRPTTKPGEYRMGVVREFIKEIRSGQWSGLNGSEGLRRTQIIDACYASAKLGREVMLNDAL